MSFLPTTRDEELVAMCAAREAWSKVAKYPVAWVVDLSHVLEVTAKQRRTFVEHLERFEPHDIAFNRGSALVVPNTFLRGVATAVFWMKPPRFPHETFANRAEAFTWAQHKLNPQG